MKLEDFKNIHAGREAFIIGKGPSLDKIRENVDKLRHGVIFALNEAIKQIAVERQWLTQRQRDDVFGTNADAWPMYCVQQDSELGDECVSVTPSVVHFMNAMQHLPGAEKKKVDVSPWNPNAILYDGQIAFEDELTAIAALKLARYMGIKRVTFACFDSWTNEFDGNGEYAACIGKKSGEVGAVGRHGANGKWIVQRAKEWMDSVDTILPSIGKLK